MNPFVFSSDNKRYHTFSFWLKEHFGHRVFKVPLDAGFGCPNRDGTCGSTGCHFCSGQRSGEFGGNRHDSLRTQFETVRQTLGQKWQTDRYIAYFQAGTATYAPTETLRKIYSEALSFEGVVGLSVATRADCLPDETVALLSELSSRVFLMVELGLQTVHDKTALALGRGHSFAQFLAGFEKLQKANIPTVVHLINGLPGETPQMMRQSAKILADLRPFGAKIHMLQVLKNTPLGEVFANTPFAVLTKEEYIALVCDQIALFPPETVLMRLTGDGDHTALLAPQWSVNKRSVLAGIDKELVRRQSFQGKNYNPERKSFDASDL